MNKITTYLLITIALLCVQELHAQQWTDISSSSDVNSLAICHAISEDICIVTGTNGKIHRTIDGGISYETVTTIFNFGEWFSDMDFSSNDVGYVCGGTAFGFHRNFIAKTIDGGITWDSLTSNEYSGSSFTNIDFVTDDLGFVTGDGNFLLKTTDGGETFTEVILPIQDSYSIQGIHWNTEDIAYVAVTLSFNTATIKQHKIYKTENAGLDWVSVYGNVVNDFDIETSHFINEINFYDENIGYASCSNGLFLKTMDGGANWTEQILSSDTTSLFDIEIVNSETLYVTGFFAYGGNFRKTFKTTNGGMTWEILDNEFRDISIAGKGYATDGNGVLFKTDFLIPNENLIVENDIKIYPSSISNFINIEIPKGLENGYMNIVNDVGVTIYSFNLQDTLIQQFDLSALSSGFYFAEILNENGTRINTTKIVKN